ncbi:Aldolase-type TIM barrel [Akanthomyces lecanii RCEF 1005]|uniref:Aldolase-type TIM barrel n=1 Tax=Akanthomyces lecanii RCEF 1005 TaxID=1081108 RepID=A0A168GVM5_CORDF|nr:Aldolase-type TIM barrel [Akanthomyces lecanii RCEF 1005]
MTQQDIEVVISQFANAARLASLAGLQGVEIHMGHGFLLSQFASQASNTRQDVFGGSATQRVELTLRIIRAVRDLVPRSFCVGVKMNAADYMESDAVVDMLEQVRLLQKEQVDYLNLSGGSFENPQMMSNDQSLAGRPMKTARTQAREGFFIETSKRIRAEFPDLIIILTGGFRSRPGIQAALESGACDLVGIGRPAIKYPHLPKDIVFNSHLPDDEARFDIDLVNRTWLASYIPPVGAGVETVSTQNLASRALKYWASKMRNI